jgi:hypothetical protein
LAPDEKPLCVRTCQDGSLEYKEVHADDDVYEVFEDIVVKVPGGALWEPFLKN